MGDRRIEYLKLSEIVGWDRNPKAHDIATLIFSIRRFGFQSPLLVNDPSGILLAGHGRVEALRRMCKSGEPLPDGIQALDGDWLVPVVQGADLPSGEADAYRLADNRLVELGGWDEEALAEVLTELAANDALEGIGWDGDDVDRLLRDLGLLEDREETFDVAAALEEEVEPRIKRGEVWRLGKHRLMCGDSTETEDVAKLMEGEKAKMVLTDPPYGVGYDDRMYANRQMMHTGRISKKFGPIIGDDKEYDPSPLLKLFGYCVEIFLWGADHYCWFLPKGGSWIVWDRKLPQQAKVPYADFELAWSKNKHAATMLRIPWGGFRNTEKGEDRYHPTQKPVALFTSFLELWGKQGDIVADPFLGSGTSLIAAEKLGRICYAMEIEPRYCEVSIQRWEDYTGERAVRVDG